MEFSKTPRCSSWSVAEVQCLLSLVAEDRIQKELDGTTRNHKVFKEISELMTAHGYDRTLQQCRDKLKKLKSDYRGIKSQIGQSGFNRKRWRWFAEIDAIYGHKLSNNGLECGVDSATSLLLSIDNQSLPTTERIDESPRPSSPRPSSPRPSSPRPSSPRPSSPRPPSPVPAAPPAAASTTAESDLSSNPQRVVTAKSLGTMQASSKEPPHCSNPRPSDSSKRIRNGKRDFDALRELEEEERREARQQRDLFVQELKDHEERAAAAQEMDRMFYRREEEASRRQMAEFQQGLLAIVGALCKTRSQPQPPPLD